MNKPETNISEVSADEIRDLEGEEGDGVVGHEGGGEIGVGKFGSGLTKLVPASYKVENESRFQSLSRLDSKSRSGMKPVPAAKPEFVLSKRRGRAGTQKAMSLESIGANNCFYDNVAGEFNEEAVDCGGIEGLVGDEELGKDWRFKLDLESECETEV